MIERDSSRESKASPDDVVSTVAKLLPLWTVDAGTLQRSVSCEDFRQAMSFINQVADEAEALNHHPTWTNTYNRVQFTLTTHDADNQITDLDIELAQRIDLLAEEAGAN